MAAHFVSNKDESVPMFKNRLLDLFSRVHFSVPPLIFIPVILYFLYQSIFVFAFPVYYIIPLILFGFAVWTFTEYNMHRFVFHWTPPGEIGKKINFMFHGVHHAYPRDSYRLVMVPAVSVPLAVIFYVLFSILFELAFEDSNLVAPFFVGFVIGYLVYDMTHYALHHANFKSAFWLELKQHHMIHHYQDPHNGFGVSTKLWDLVYRTTFKRKSENRVTVGEAKPHLSEV